MEFLNLILLGFGIGTLSGFFGIGGGTVLVPALLFMGFDLKVAIGISIIQMVFTSIFGSYLNFKRATLNLKDGLIIGFGGFSGALLSGFIVSKVPEKLLGYLFLLFVAFAIYKFFVTPAREHHDETVEINKFALFGIGFGVGTFAISVGIGGSLLITPILVGFFKYPLKKAVSSGLFFVLFSSIAGFISFSVFGELDYNSGFLIGIGSLIGVYFGIEVDKKTDVKKHKNWLVWLYILIFISTLYKIAIV